MADPTSYTVGYDFSGFADGQPGTPLPGVKVDVELANIQTSIAALVAATKDVRRSDGALKNSIVTLDSLSDTVKKLLGVNSTDLQAVADAIADVSTVAGAIDDVSTVAGVSADVSTVAGIAADVTGVAGISADVTAVDGIKDDVSTVAGISADVTAVAGDLANINLKLAKSANLSDLADAPTARTNLGLGAIATLGASAAVPTGGTTGQVLAKASATDRDTEWVDQSAGAFATKALAAAHTPATAPAFIQIAGEVAAGDGGEALFKKVASDPGDYRAFSITLSGGGTAWYQLVRNSVPANVISLVSVLSGTEVADVLTGANAIDISAKIAGLIADAPDGSIIDLSMLTGTVTLGSSIFSEAYSPVTIRTGKVTLKYDPTNGAMSLPSGLTWQADGTTLTVPSVPDSIASAASPGTGMLQTWLAGGTCSGTYNTSTITVSSATGIREGTLIAAFGTYANGDIVHTLAGNITSSSTTFTFSDDVSNTITGGVVYLQIDSETMIGTVTAGTFTATTRGANGTTAAAHTAGTSVFRKVAAVFEVASVSGTTVTLKAKNLIGTFSNTIFRVGAVDVTIDGDLTIDGGYDPTANPSAASWCNFAPTLANRLRVRGRQTYRNAPFANLFLFACQNYNIEFDTLQNGGNGSFGGNLWVYGKCMHGRIKGRQIVNTLTGDTTGVVIDNKSFGVDFFPLDYAGTDNVVEVDEITGVKWGSTLSAQTYSELRARHINASAYLGHMDTGTPQTTASRPPTGSRIEVGKASGTYTSVFDGASITNDNAMLGGRSERVLLFSSNISSTAITAGSRQSFTISVTGAKTGDRVHLANQEIYAAGLVITTAYVSAAGTVTIIVENTGAASASFSATPMKGEVRGPL